MALMLRARGVPARVVNGFQMGNTVMLPTSTRWPVGCSPWVEVYFPSTAGWF
jgi:transglutaminase-like putative cysteine protease